MPGLTQRRQVGGPVAARLQGEDLVHVIDFRPFMVLHAPLPWLGIELIAD